MAGLRLLAVGMMRCFHFARLVLPICLHYKFKQFLGRLLGRTIPNQEWDAMHHFYAPRCLQIAETMQGFYIKIGQHMATMGTSVPTVYRDCFKSLLEHCPSQPFRIVKDMVETELGPLESTFENFSPHPMNAASTGQVHSAKLKNGHDVVVKVQHPDAEWKFGVDLHLFVSAAELMAPNVVGIVKQIRKNLVNEFDYALEAAQQREAAGHLQEFKNIVVPLPVDCYHPVTPTAKGLCTKHVLVMDKLFGMSLADWGRAQLEEEAKRQGKTLAELQEECMKTSSKDWEKLRPSFFGVSAYLVANKGADFACNTLLFAYNWGLGYVLQRPVKYVNTPLPPNIHVVVNELMAAQGHMLFGAGFINCDPHAGNVMLLNDGRIGLIDWGSVVRLTVQQRCIMAGLFIAVADQDDIMSADCMRALGGRCKHDWDWTQAQWAKLTSWSLQECEKFDFERLTQVMDTIDPTVREADAVFIMAFKNQLYTRQVCAMLGFFDINSSVTLRQMGVECLKKAGWPIPRTKPTVVPMPLQVRELLSPGAPLCEDSFLEEQPEEQSWLRSPSFVVHVLASYVAYNVLRYVGVSPSNRALAFLVICTVAALAMVLALHQYLERHMGRNHLDLRFNPNHWELKLGNPCR